MFSIEDFVASARAALSEGSRAPLAVKELIERATSRPHEIEAAVGDVTAIPPFTVWHRSPELTILHVVWPPQVDLFAHDHNMWATIGLYGGREDNRFFQRHDDGTIERRPKGISLRAGDAVALGADTIHSVANPSRQWTGSIHTYGGDFFAPGRSMWPDLDAPADEFDSASVEAVLEAAATRARARS